LNEKAYIYVFPFGLGIHDFVGLYAPSAEDRDHLPLHLLHRDRAPVPAVRRLRPVVAHHEHMTVRHPVRVLDSLFRVRRIQDFSPLHRPVDRERARLVEHHHVRFPRDDPAELPLSVHVHGDHVVFRVILLHPEDDHQVAVLHRREHSVPAHLRYEEYLREQDVPGRRDQHDLPEEAAVAGGGFQIGTALPDDLLRGAFLLIFRHCRSPVHFRPLPRTADASCTSPARYTWRGTR